VSHTCWYEEVVAISVLGTTWDDVLEVLLYVAVSNATVVVTIAV